MNASLNKHIQAPVVVEQPLTAYLKSAKLAGGFTSVQLAQATGLNRMTVAAAEGASDPRLSTVVALLDAMGYGLLPCPKHLMAEVASFINNDGQVLSLPAGVSAPLGQAQRIFHAAAASQEGPL